MLDNLRQNKGRVKRMYDLKGLTSASPIGFMAALGLLRVLVSDCGLDIRLGWQKGHAVIEGIDADTTIDTLVKHMEGRSEAKEFNWTDTSRKVTPGVYQAACVDMGSDSRALSFMAGWGTDTVLRDGFISTTRMDMTSGQQKLIRDLRKLAENIGRDHFESALLGGPYEGQSSFGLDPVAVRSHAHECKAPTKTKAPGKPGMIWLAFESIPLHPVVPIASNRVQTLGWNNYPNISYVWPVWDALLTLEEIKSLRALPLDRLASRPGVREVWASKYGSSGKYGMLLPAVRER